MAIHFQVWLAKFSGMRDSQEPVSTESVPDEATKKRLEDT